MQIELTITYTPDGSVNVTGPVNDKVLCYGLLESAKDAIRIHTSKPPNMVLPASAEVLQLVKH